MADTVVTAPRPGSATCPNLQFAGFAKQFQQLQDKRRELAEAVLAPAINAKADQQQLISRLNDEKENLEKSLARSNPRFGESLTKPRASSDLLDKIPDDVAIIELVRAAQIAHVEPGRSLLHTNVDHYEAFVLRNRGGKADVDRVPLGPAAELDSLINTWSDRLIAEVIKPTGESRAELDKVGSREQIWIPLGKSIEGHRNLIVIPDGTFSRLPWSALPGKGLRGPHRRGPMQLRRQVSGASRIAEILASKRIPIDRGTLLLVGGVDYGTSEGPTASVAWPQLDQTLSEVRQVEKLLGESEAQRRCCRERRPQ